MKQSSRKIIGASTAIVGMLALAFPMASAAVAVPSDFTVSITQNGGTGESGKLQWSSPGCPTILGETPQPTFELTKDGKKVSPTGNNEYMLKAGTAGTYKLTGTCTYKWHMPKKATAEITVKAEKAEPAPPTPAPPTTSTPDESAPAPTPQPQPGGANSEPNTPANQLEIVSDGFVESLTSRMLTWKVTGCKDSQVTVDVLRDGKTVQMSLHSATGKVNASNWPTGKYTLRAVCGAENGAARTHATRDFTLKRANLSVTYHGEKLFSLIPRPGDRVAINSQPTHNLLRFTDGSTAGAFITGEKVKLSAMLGGQTFDFGVEVADAQGNIATVKWIPQVADIKEFTIKATGETSGFVLDYVSKVLPESPVGIFFAAVENEPQKLRIYSHPADNINSAAFEKNRKVQLVLLNMNGEKVVPFDVSLAADERGVVDSVVEFPKNLSDGRYTILAKTPLGAKGYYRAYFYVKNQQVYPQWGEPVTPKPAPAPVPKPKLQPNPGAPKPAPAPIPSPVPAPAPTPEPAPQPQPAPKAEPHSADRAPAPAHTAQLAPAGEAKPVGTAPTPKLDAAPANTAKAASQPALAKTGAASGAVGAIALLALLGGGAILRRNRAV